MLLKDRLKKKLAQKLPAEKAHSAVMSYKRRSAEEIIAERKDVRESAVLCLLAPEEDSFIIYFMERSVYGGTHSGQISFPGGKSELEDSSLEETALRETEEELGIPRKLVEVLGELSPIYIPPSNFLVYPYVGMLTHQPELNPSPDEVQKVLKGKLNDLLNNDAISETSVKLSEGNVKMKVRHYTVEGEIVWGATAMILSELLFLIKNS